MQNIVIPVIVCIAVLIGIDAFFFEDYISLRQCA